MSQLKAIMSDGVLAFPCPKCGQSLEVGLHVVETAAKPTRKSPITGTTYGHRVEFIAEAPHLHAEFWGHLVRCHQPDPHPYMRNDAQPGAAECPCVEDGSPRDWCRIAAAPHCRYLLPNRSEGGAR